MSRYRRLAVVAGCALLIALLSAVVVNRYAPPPSADSARASEDAFAEGLEEREFVPPMMGPGRWTSGGATFRFRHLPEGPATLQVRVRAHQNAVRVLADRVSLGLIPVGDRGADFELNLKGPSLDVSLVTRPFLARGGRRLGTFLDRVTLIPRRSILPPLSLVALFGLPALVLSLASPWVGLSSRSAIALSTVTSLCQVMYFWPHGLLRSSYANSMTVLLAVGIALIALVSRHRRSVFIALLAAFIVQGVGALHPLVIGFDATFHAHNLADVVAGDVFLVSETQHKPPFQFPYGVTFYLPLVPFVRAGYNLVDTVRVGAAAAGVLASLALFWLMARGAGRVALAAGTVVFLQIIPWTFDVYSNGNYSNVFAQAAVVAFVAWWVAGKPLGWPAGAVLFVVGALGHLSAFFFLLALSAALVFVHRRDRAEERAGLIALAVGLGGAAFYYGQFASLILEQMPRLFEGGGGTGTRTFLESLGAQLHGALTGWGVPAMVLAFFGRPRSDAPIGRDLRAVWLAGAALATAAVVTPIEVRYLYALTFALAIAAAEGTRRLFAGGIASRLAAVALVAAQVVLGTRNILLAMLYDWRA